VTESVEEADLAAVAAQLGRAPRGTHAVGHRCPCGLPDVVVTEPRLPDGTPFPTTYYLTCPRAASLIGTLEGSGLMREMEERLRDNEALAASYATAHRAYLADRAELGDALAAGRGVNPLGDEVLDRLGEWWAEGPCVRPSDPSSVVRGRDRDG
jgi:hypothetical protein